MLGFNPPKEEGGGDNFALRRKLCDKCFVVHPSDYNSNSREFSVAAQELILFVRKKQLVIKF